MNLSKRDMKLMRAALHSAVENSTGMIDAYCTEWAKDRDARGMPYKVVANGNRRHVNSLKRQIESWRKLRQKIEKELG